MHARRSLAGAVIMGAFAAMAFAGASAGAPAQAQQEPAGAAPITGKSLALKKLGTSVLSPAAGKPVQKSAAKALAAQLATKALLLAGQTNRPVAKIDKPATQSFRAPNSASMAAVAAEDQPIVGKRAIVQSSTGVNAYQQEFYGGYNLEPPDPSLAAGAGFVVQVVNSQVQISNQSLGKLSAPVSMESFFGDFFNALFDPLVTYNHGTGRWYLTEAVSDFASFSGVYIAVSSGSDPRGAWTIYYLDLGTFGGAGGCAVFLCLADQPNLGSDQYTISISTNQFDLSGGFGCATGFCGAAYVLIDKWALALGLAFPNTVGFDISNTPVIFPDFNFGDCVFGGGPCWYSIQPADSPNGKYDTRLGGTQWALSALDFFGLPDNRIAIWRFQNTSSIGGVFPDISGTLYVRDTHTYYSNPPLARQPQGIVGPNVANGNPLGDYLVLLGLCGPGSPPAGCGNPGPIATNDDRMRDTSMLRQTNGQHMIWGGNNTAVGGSAGIAFWGVNVTGSPTVTRSGYIHNPSADVYFPAVANIDDGSGLFAYTVSSSTLYPSSAYSVFTPSLNPPAIEVSNQGQGVQDGFTQYVPITGFYRPRWGDYSGAATDGKKIFFTSEFIPKPNCSLFVFKDIDDTCGGTRTFFANWGTSVNKLTAP